MDAPPDTLAATAALVNASGPRQGCSRRDYCASSGEPTLHLDVAGCLLMSRSAREQDIFAPETRRVAFSLSGYSKSSQY